jgi:hypothetical protein
MKCGYKFLEGIDRDFPVNEVDIYRVRGSGKFIYKAGRSWGKTLH